MAPYRIALLPGDGIGPEVMGAAVSVLREVASGVPDLRFDLTEYESGCDLYRRTGVPMASEVWDECKRADAVLLAAWGLPDVRKPDGTEVQPELMMGLRWLLEVYAAVRPIKLHSGVPSPLGNTAEGIDMVIVREASEGLFASYGGGAVLKNSVASDTIIITREGTEKVCRYAFSLARRRQGRPLDGKRMVTCVDKANVFRSYAFFRKVFSEVAEQNGDIGADAAYVDAMSMYMVQRPSEFDVLVMENQFGDILSDLGAGLVGGLGMAPSAEIGDKHALFQPSHGSAPTIAGLNVANPIAMILSAAMMLEWLGDTRDDEAAKRGAALVEGAVELALRSGAAQTRDLGGSATTAECGDAIVRALHRL